MAAATDFPHLDAIVRSRLGRDLDGLAAARDGEFRLDSAVRAYLNGVRGQNRVPDPAGYLFTLDRLAANLAAPEQQKLGEKICNLNHETQFLDTVGEASLAEHLRARGELIGVERPLGVRTKDVDVLARVADQEYWVDVLSVSFKEAEIPDEEPVPELDWDTATEDELSAALPTGTTLLLGTPETLAETLVSVRARGVTAR